MKEFSTDEWKRMIKHYHRDMMERYASKAPSQQHSAPTPSPDAVSTAATAINETSSDSSENLNDIGLLQIRVSAENQAIPLEGAMVTITRSQDAHTYLEKALVTDSSGLTPIVELPTKSRTLSLSPSNDTPYTVYSVDVSADGYFSKQFTNLPIYGGVTAIQSVSMVPVPEAGDRDITLIYPQSGPSL